MKCVCRMSMCIVHAVRVCVCVCFGNWITLVEKDKTRGPNQMEKWKYDDDA